MNPENDALSYWINQLPDDYYLGRLYQTDLLIETLRRDFPAVRSLLEFGCGTGRNLYYTMLDMKQIDVAVGVDVNAKMVELGRRKYPELKLFVSSNGLDLLDYTPSKSKDVVFTVSVLDHLPDRELVFKAIEHFFRIARIGVILFEPYCGVVGLVYPEYTDTPFSYSWDYLRIFQELWDRNMVRNIGVVRRIPHDISTALSKKSLGPYYTLYSCDVKNGS